MILVRSNYFKTGEYVGINIKKQNWFMVDQTWPFNSWCHSLLCVCVLSILCMFYKVVYIFYSKHMKYVKYSLNIIIKFNIISADKKYEAQQLFFCYYNPLLTGMSCVSRFGCPVEGSIIILTSNLTWGAKKPETIVTSN